MTKALLDYYGSPAFEWVRLIATQDAEGLARKATPIIGFRPDPNRFLEECIQAYINCPDEDRPIGYHVRCWSESSWESWIRNRGDKLRPQIDTHKQEVGHITCTFHVFFIFIDETEDQLARLRVRDRALHPEIARSKIHTMLLSKIKPIDVQAALGLTK